MMINNLRWVGVLGAFYVACAVPGTAQAVSSATAPWLEALNARSAALNDEYGLGGHAQRRQLGAPGPDWLVGLNARSEAMNRYYGLGRYARKPAKSMSAPDWLVALNARSDALNRMYGLGGGTPKR